MILFTSSGSDSEQFGRTHSNCWDNIGSWCYPFLRQRWFSWESIESTYSSNFSSNFWNSTNWSQDT